MDRDKKVRIGLIGCGYWGPNHLRILKSFPDCEVKGVYDKNPETLAKIAAHHADLTLTGNYREFLDLGLDAAVVATPTATHYEIVRQLLLDGLHVLCEKPLTVTSAEAGYLIATAEMKGVKLMVGHIYLYNGFITGLKRIIDGGDLGNVYYMTSRRLNLGPIRYDVGTVCDLASHDISIANYLLGGVPIDVSARGGAWLSRDCEDAAFISLTYGGNVMVNIEVSWLSPKKIRELTIVGSKQMAVLDEISRDFPLIVYNKGAARSQEYSDYGDFLKISMWEGDATMPRFAFDEPMKLQDRDFIDAIKHDRQPLCDGRFALGVVQVLEKANQAIG